MIADIDRFWRCFTAQLWVMHLTLADPDACNSIRRL
jgi:hypothetical protein